MWHKLGGVKKKYLVPSLEVRLSIRRALDAAYRVRRRRGRDCIPLPVMNATVDPPWVYTRRDGTVDERPYFFDFRGYTGGGFDLYTPTNYDHRICEQGGSHIMNTYAPKYVDTLLDPLCFEEHDEVSVDELKEKCAARIERLKREKEAQVQAARGTHGGVNQRRR
jgi:hypothetical protein